MPRGDRTTCTVDALRPLTKCKTRRAVERRWPGAIADREIERLSGDGVAVTVLR